MMRINTSDDLLFVRVGNGGGIQEVSGNEEDVGKVDGKLGLESNGEKMVERGGEMEKDQGLGVILRGSYTPDKFAVSVLVLAEKWPSWLWFLQSYNWDNVIALVKKKLSYRHIWNLVKLFC